MHRQTKKIKFTIKISTEKKNEKSVYVFRFVNFAITFAFEKIFQNETRLKFENVLNLNFQLYKLFGDWSPDDLSTDEEAGGEIDFEGTHVILEFNRRSGLLMLKGGRLKVPAKYSIGHKWMELSKKNPKRCEKLSKARSSVRISKTEWDTGKIYHIAFWT